jgi:subtilase-type serine protease
VGLNTLTITGNTYFNNGSTYKVEVSDSSSGQIAVGGQVTIEDGAKVSIFNPSSLININKPILTAGSFFNSNVFSNPLYSFKIDGPDLIVDRFLGASGVVEAAAQAGGGSVSTNYINGASLIDRVLQDSGASAALQSRLVGSLEKIYDLAEAGNSVAEAALKQLIGEEALTAANANFDTIRDMNAALYGHFNSLRRASLPPAAGNGEAPNRIWLTGFGNWARQKNHDNVFGYDYNAGGVIMGYDREVEAVEGLTLGASGAWAGGKLKNKDGLSRTDIDTFSLGLYSSYEFGNGFFLDANLGYGHAQNDAEINLALGGKKESSFDSDSFQVGANLGYKFKLTDSTSLTPSVGLQYIHVKQDGWREKIVSDPNNLAVANWFGDAKSNFLEIPLLLTLNSEITTASGVVVTPELRLGGTIAANKSKSELRMGFVGSNDTAMIYGIDPGKSRLQAGAGIKIQVNDTVDIYANYDLEARSKYKAHSASAGIGFSF